MGLLYTRSIRLTIENCFLGDAICPLVSGDRRLLPPDLTHRVEEEASERASIGLARVPSYSLEFILCVACGSGL
jgi:hypothetical protein